MQNGEELKSDSVQAESAQILSPTVSSGQVKKLHLGFWITVASIITIFIIGMMIFALNKANHNHTTNKAAPTIKSQKVDTTNLTPEASIFTVTNDQVVINGQLQANQYLVIAPTTQPSTAITGLVYLDKSDNTLRYYNGTKYITVADSSAVSSLAASSANSGVTSLQGSTGSITLLGGSGLTITTNGTTITMSLPQNLAKTASPTFNALTLSSLNCTANLNGGALTTDASGNIVCSDDTATPPGAGITTLNGQIGAIQTFANDTNITISSAGDVHTLGWSGTLAVARGGTGAANAAGARTNLGVAASGANSDITSLSGLTTALSVAQGGTGTTSFTTNGVLYGNGAGALQVTAAGTTGQCFLGNTGGAPTWGACPGSGGSGVDTVGVLDSQSPVADGAQIIGTTLYLQSADTSFAGLVNTGSQSFAGDKTFTDNLTVEGSNLTVGTASSTDGSIILQNAANAFTVTLIASGQTVGSATFSLPDTAGVSDTFCLQALANCLGGSGGANTALSNLSGVAINTSLLTGSSTIDLGSGANPFRDLYLGGTATNNFQITGIASVPQIITLPDETGTVCLQNSTSCGFAASQGSNDYINFAPSNVQEDHTCDGQNPCDTSTIFVGKTAQTGNIMELQGWCTDPDPNTCNSGLLQDVFVLQGNGDMFFRSLQNSDNAFSIRAVNGTPILNISTNGPSAAFNCTVDFESSKCVDTVNLDDTLIQTYDVDPAELIPTTAVLVNTNSESPTHSIKITEGTRSVGYVGNDQHGIYLPYALTFGQNYTLDFWAVRESGGGTMDMTFDYYREASPGGSPFESGAERDNQCRTDLPVSTSKWKHFVCNFTVEKSGVYGQSDASGLFWRMRRVALPADDTQNDGRVWYIDDVNLIKGGAVANQASLSAPLLLDTSDNQYALVVADSDHSGAGSGLLVADALNRQVIIDRVANDSTITPTTTNPALKVTNNDGAAALFQSSISSNSNPTVIIQGVSGQSQKLLSFQNSAGNELTGFNSSGQLVFHESAGSSDSGTLRVASSLSGSKTYILPDFTGGGGTATICITGLACAGSGGSLQDAYNNSDGGTTPEILLNSTQGAVDIQDASTTLGGNLFNIWASNAILGTDTPLFSVDNTGAIKTDATGGELLQLQSAGNNVFNVASNGEVAIGTPNLASGSIDFYNSNNGFVATLTSATLSGFSNFILPDIGSTTQQLCTEATCVQLSPSSAQADASANNSIFINDTGGGNLLELQNNGTDVLVVDNFGSIISGGGSFNGSINLYDANNGFTAGIAANPTGLTTDRTFYLPDVGTGAMICVDTGNCAGAGSGITGSGTPGTIAKFTGSGAIGDSILSESGTTLTNAGNVVIQGTGGTASLTLGTASGNNGSIIFKNSTNSNTLTLQSGVTGGTNPVFTLPTADGTSNQCLQTNGSGVLSFANCVGGSGGASGVSSLNTLTGALTIQGTSNQIIVTPSGGNTLTLSTPQNINTTSSPQFVTVTGSTSLLTPLLDANSAAVLNLGTTNATAINLNQNTAIATGKTLTANTIDSTTATTLTIGASTATSIHLDQNVVVASAKSLTVNTLDSTTATTLSIGTSTATAITIGKSGVTTTNAGALTVTEALLANASTGTGLTVTNNTDLNNLVAIGNNSALSSTGTLNVSHIYTGVNCILGCYGINTVTHIGSGNTNLLSGFGVQAWGSLVNNASTDTIADVYGMRLAPNTSTGGGTISNNFGLFIQAQTIGTLDFGAGIEAADTQTLWLSTNADNTTAAAGIGFGTSRDTQLYRSAANVLQTNAAFTFGSGIPNGANGSNGTSAIAALTLDLSSSSFGRGGNSTGASGTGGAGSAINLTTGNGGTSSGTTAATAGAGGAINLTTGNGGASSGANATGGAGGVYNLLGGNGGNASSSGASTTHGGAGGGFSLQGGTGGNVAGTGGAAVAGAGGGFTFLGGAGGDQTNGSGTSTAGVGGSVSLQGGAGGNITSATGVYGVGGAVSLTGGTAIKQGGAINITGGQVLSAINSITSGGVVISSGQALGSLSGTQSSLQSGTVTISSGNLTYVNDTSTGRSGDITIITGTGYTGFSNDGNTSSGNVSIDIGQATGSGTNGTISIGTTNATGTGGITIGNASQTSTITLGQSTAGQIINIGHATVATANTQTIQIGDAATGTGKNVVSIGTTNDGSTLTLQGGNTSSAVSIQSAASGTINVGTANAANTIQIGNTANAIAQTINIGNNATGSSTDTIAIGNLLSTSTTTIQGGTGAGAISIQAGTSGTISIGTVNNLSVVIGKSGGTGTLTVNGASTFNGNLEVVNGHIKSTQTTKPTIGTPTNCGSSPSAAVTNASTDNAGSFTITAGTGGGYTTCDVTITFNTAFGAAPKSIILQPTTAVGSATGLKDAQVSATAAGTFTVKLTANPSGDSEVNGFYYMVIE